MNKFRILDAYWINGAGSELLAGIVLYKNEEGIVNCRAGVLAFPTKETNDSQKIIDWGSDFPIGAAKVLFPGQKYDKDNKKETSS